MNTENRDQKENQVGSSTAPSNHQEEQQDDHQSRDLNPQSKGREPRTQRQHMAAPNLDTAGRTQTSSEPFLPENWKKRLLPFTVSVSYKRPHSAVTRNVSSEKPVQV